MTTIRELIDEMDEMGYDWVAREMETIVEYPEMLEGDPTPSIENMGEADGMMMVHFYVGVAFGAAMQKEHDYDLN